MAVKALQRYGYTVLEAPGGEEALTLSDAEPGPIHLLVTDVIMPRMGGRELGKQLVIRRPGLPVLFVSGYPESAISQQGVLDPDLAYLQKPFTPEVLARKVRDVLRPMRSRAAI
jgi:CheY-like chemotaxis protein